MKGVRQENPNRWIVVKDSTKKMLDERKLVEEESYNSVLVRILNGEKKVARRNGA